MMSAIIIDDEWAAGQLLSVQLQATNAIDVKMILQNPLELMPYIEKHHVDVVFLDVSMPEMSGIMLAEQLSMMSVVPEIIFVTAYSDYAVEAFRVNALDYVVKPVHDKDLQRVVPKLTKRVDEKRKWLKKDREGKNHKNFQQLALQFPTAKCEELYIYLLLKSSEPASKWKIIEDLWPGKDGEKGESSLRTTVFRLNQTLANAQIEARVKASKGYYQMIQQTSTYVGFFPPLEALSLQRETMLPLLKMYNPIPLLNDKDYVWLVGTKQKYEYSFYRWATNVIQDCSVDERTLLTTLQYLFDYYPWNEQLIQQMMPLILKVEGKGALAHFFQTLQKSWLGILELPVNDEIVRTYNELIR